LCSYPTSYFHSHRTLRPASRSSSALSVTKKDTTPKLFPTTHARSMASDYQPWYDPFMNDTVDGRSQENPYSLGPTDYDLLLPTYHVNGRLASISDADLPPSIRAAVQSPSTPTYDQKLWSDYLGVEAITGDENVDERATDPFSFAQRSYQLQQSRKQRDDVYLSANSDPGLFSDPRRDSGIGSLGDGGDTSHQESLPPDHDQNCSCRNNHLPYHLMHLGSVVPCKAEGRRKPSPREVPSLPAYSASSSNGQNVPCSLCPDKLFTGVWAQRNLNRHLEAVHAPYSSHDGVKHFRCSMGECSRTFRRNDARLVHERRSHPELNRAPATRRKKSGEM